MSKDFRPMLEDPSESELVRELLEAGRDFRVTDYDFAQGLSQHLAHVEMGTPPPDWSQSLPQGGGSATGATAGGAAVSAPLAAWIAVPVVTAGVVVAVMLGGDPAPAPVEPQSLELAPVVSPSAEVEPVVAPAPEPDVAPEPSEPEPSAAPGNAAASEAQPVARKRRSARRGEPVAEEAAPEASAQPSPAPRRTRTAEQRARDLEDVLREPPPSVTADGREAAPRVERAESGEAAPRDDASLEREMRMLAVAQRVLHTDPERALRLARQGERAFPDTMFTQERRQVLLLALVQLGRMDEARKLAAPYLRKYPKGPFSDRVRRALATGRVER